ncbi:MAG TPA: UxaA family hydrolase [Pseudothermotoga sp.]|mgnify:CR=1 FL=1|nr:UxaA family hydrolase [Pseudothermotoga sp.]HOK83017.1 UxaA family hydrolase [Pseudothermotoga sp.]HPP69814.1 UxaA family hydrolase [Pseudothermotoga sp.]
MDAIVFSKKDNVATAIRNLSKGEEVHIDFENTTLRVKLNHDIPFGHKFAIKEIEKDSEVFKYGEPIGVAIEKIRTGDYVHVHNVSGKRAVRRYTT